jgi:hypothetical protein
MVVEHACHKRQAGLYSLSRPFAFHAFKSTAGPARFQCTSNAYSVQVQCKYSAVVMQPAKKGGQQMEIAADRTGSMACALQAALRLSNVAFAAHLEISARTGRCLAAETGACTRGWRCSSFPALPLGRSRRRSGCDSPCSHVSSTMPGRACRSPMPGPPPGHNAGTPQNTSGPAQDGQSGRGNPGSRPAAADASTASGHGHTMATGGTAPDPFSRPAQHGRPRP